MVVNPFLVASRLASCRFKKFLEIAEVAYSSRQKKLECLIIYIYTCSDTRFVARVSDLLRCPGVETAEMQS